MVTPAMASGDTRLKCEWAHLPSGLELEGKWRERKRRKPGEGKSFWSGFLSGAEVTRGNAGLERLEVHECRKQVPFLAVGVDQACHESSCTLP